MKQGVLTVTTLCSIDADYMGLEPPLGNATGGLSPQKIVGKSTFWLSKSQKQ